MLAGSVIAIGKRHPSNFYVFRPCSLGEYFSILKSQAAHALGFL